MVRTEKKVCKIVFNNFWVFIEFKVLLLIFVVTDIMFTNFSKEFDDDYGNF